MCNRAFVNNNSNNKCFQLVRPPLSQTTPAAVLTIAAAGVADAAAEPTGAGAGYWCCLPVMMSVMCLCGW